jgi:hypothetical protein
MIPYRKFSDTLKNDSYASALPNPPKGGFSRWSRRNARNSQEIYKIWPTNYSLNVLA